MTCHITNARQCGIGGAGGGPAIRAANSRTQAFLTIVRERRGEQLDGWIEAAGRSEVAELQRFAAGLGDDLAAARAGLTSAHSNGQIEGQINRLKLLRRTMDGWGRLRLGSRRLVDQARAAGLVATRSPAHEAALSSMIAAEATAGDQDPLLRRQGVAGTADRTFTARATVEASGGIRIDVPFDPAEAWGPRDRYHVTGTVDGRPVRSALRVANGAAALTLGPASGHRRWINDGDLVEVSLRPEGPQAGQVAGDIAAALDAEPAARRAFDSLATFYRKGWLTWIEATTRRPAVRAERIAQMVAQVKEGHKQRPR